jgi:hypothetical protein
MPAFQISAVLREFGHLADVHGRPLWHPSPGMETLQALLCAWNDAEPAVTPPLSPLSSSPISAAAGRRDRAGQGPLARSPPPRET